MKIVLRISYADGRVVERDIVGAINIIKYYSTYPQVGGPWRLA
jgi:transposase